MSIWTKNLPRKILILLQFYNRCSAYLPSAWKEIRVRKAELIRFKLNMTNKFRVGIRDQGGSSMKKNVGRKSCMYIFKG